MTDISKCAGTGCPLKDKCWRHNAPASTFMQSYVSPRYDSSTNDCPNYWDRTLDSDIPSAHTPKSNTYKQPKPKKE